MNDNGWHVEKRLTVGHIITTAMLLFGIISAWTTLDKRLVVMETAFNMHQEQQRQTEAMVQGQNKEILKELKELRADLNRFMVETGRK